MTNLVTFYDNSGENRGDKVQEGGGKVDDKNYKLELER